MSTTDMAQKAEQKEFFRRRREVTRQNWQKRLKKWTWYAVLAEVFLVALWPAGATIALLAGVLLTLVRFKLDKEFKFRHLPLDTPALLFVVISAISILSSPDRGFSFYNWYNLVGVYALTYLLIGQNLREKREVKQLLLALGSACIIVLLYGFYQFMFGIDISAMKWVDGEAFPELRKRVFSTWENPNILAGYLDAMICLGFGLFVKAETKNQRIILGGIMLAMAACLAMTYARGACLVIAIIFAGYGMIKDWRVLIACIVIGGGLLLADPILYERLTSIFTKVDTSAEMRLAFWESTIAMIQDHPLLGIGWGAYWMVYPEYDFYLQGADIMIVHAHNLYLNYAAEIGIPGAITFFWFFFGTMWQAGRQNFLAEAADKTNEQSPFALKKEAAADAELQQIDNDFKRLKVKLSVWREFLTWPDYRLLNGMSLGISLAVLSIALNGFTDDLLFNIPSSMFLWMLAGIVGALTRFNDEERQDHERTD